MVDPDKPLEHLTLVENDIKPRAIVDPEPEAPGTTEERLRDFEITHFGEDHLRHGGSIEKGRGSAANGDREDGSWGAKHREHHAALEALIEAEKEHQGASAAEAAAYAKLEAAVKRASETEEAI